MKFHTTNSTVEAEYIEEEINIIEKKYNVSSISKLIFVISVIQYLLKVLCVPYIVSNFHSVSKLNAVYRNYLLES